MLSIYTIIDIASYVIILVAFRNLPPAQPAYSKGFDDPVSISPFTKKPTAPKNKEKIHPEQMYPPVKQVPLPGNSSRTDQYNQNTLPGSPKTREAESQRRNQQLVQNMMVEAMKAKMVGGKRNNY